MGIREFEADPSMLERVLEKLLVQILTPYVDGISRDKLHLGVFKGALELQDLAIKQDALFRLGLEDFSVRSGSIGHFKLAVPWTQLYSGKLVASIDRVHLEVESIGETYVNVPEDELIGQLREAKKQAIEVRVNQLIDLLEARRENEAADSGAPGQSGQKRGYVVKIVRKILHNLTIKLHSVSLKFINKNRGLACGLEFPVLAVLSTDATFRERDSKEEVLEAGSCLYKLMNLTDLSMSMSPAGSYDMRQATYVLSPISASLQLSHLPGEQTMRLRLEVATEQLAGVTLRRSQVKHLRNIQTDIYEERQRLHSMLVSPEQEKDIFADSMASMASYSRLYERQLLHEWSLADETSEALNDADLRQLQLLEDAFSARLLARARWHVRTKVGAMNEEVARRQREVEKTRFAQDQVKKGWISRVRSKVWSSSSDQADGQGQEATGEAVAWLSASEKEELVRDIEDETNVESVDLPQQFLFEFVLGQMSLDLEEDRFDDAVQRQLLSLALRGANFMVGVHLCADHRGQDSAEWQVDVRLDGFQAHHATTALFRFCPLLELPSSDVPAKGGTEQDDSRQAARLTIESRLEKEQNLMKLTFEFAPLEVHCLPGAVEQVIEFWRAPPRTSAPFETMRVVDIQDEAVDDRDLQFEMVVHMSKSFFAARGRSAKQVAEQMYERIPDKMQLWINIASPIVHVPVAGLGSAMFSLGQLCVKTPHACAYSTVDLDINLQKTALRAISLRGERFDMIQPVPMHAVVEYRGSEDSNHVAVRVKVKDMVLSLAPQALQILISTPGAMASIMNPKIVDETKPSQPQQSAQDQSRAFSKESPKPFTNPAYEYEDGGQMERTSTIDRAAHFAQEVLGKDGTSMIDSVARKVEEVRRAQFRMNLSVELNEINVTFADSIVPVLRFRAEFPPPGFVMVQQTMPSFVTIDVGKTSLDVETLNPRNGAWEPLAEQVHYGLTVQRTATGDDSDGRQTHIVLTGQEPLLLNFTPSALRRACWIIPLFVRSVTFSLTDSDQDSIGKALNGTEVKYRVVNICENTLFLRFASRHSDDLEMIVEPTGSNWQSLDRHVLPHFVTGLSVKSQHGNYSEQLSLDRVGAVAIPGTGYTAELLTPSPSHRLLLLSTPLRVHNNTDLTLRVRFHDATDDHAVLPFPLLEATVCDAALLGHVLPDYKERGQYENRESSDYETGSTEILLPKNYVCSVPPNALVRTQSCTIDKSQTWLSVMPAGLSVGWSNAFVAGVNADSKLLSCRGERARSQRRMGHNGKGRGEIDNLYLACESSTYIHTLPAPTALTRIVLLPTLALMNALPIGNLTVRFNRIAADFNPVPGAWQEARVPSFTRLSIYSFDTMLRDGVSIQAKLADDLNWSHIVTFGPDAFKESDNMQMFKLRHTREGAPAGILVEPLNHIDLRISCPNWFIDRSGLNKSYILELRKETRKLPNENEITLLPADCLEEELDLVMYAGAGRDISCQRARMPLSYSVFSWRTPRGGFVFCLQAEDIAPNDVLGAQCQVMILRPRLVLTNASPCDIELSFDRHREDRSMRLHAGQSVDHHYLVDDKEEDDSVTEVRFRPYRNPPCPWSDTVVCGDVAAGSTPFAISESTGKGAQRGSGVEVWSVEVAPVRGAIAVSFRQGSDFVAKNLVRRAKVPMYIKPHGGDHTIGQFIVPQGASVPYGWMRPFRADRKRSVDLFIGRALYTIDDVRRTQRKPINQHNVVLVVSRMGTQTLLTLQDYDHPVGGGRSSHSTLEQNKAGRSSLQVEVKLGRLGISIIEEIPKPRELLYAQLDLIRVQWEKTDMDMQSLRLAISEAQVDCSLPGRMDASTAEHQRAGLLNQERLAVIMANCADGDRSFLDIVMRRGATSSRDFVLPFVEIACDAFDMTIDDGWLEPLVAWIGQCRSSDASTRGLAYAKLVRMAGKSVLDQYEVPDLPSVVQIDAMHIMPLNVTMWCLLKLRSVQFLPQHVQTALRVLSLGGHFTLDGAALSLPQQRLNPHRGSLSDFVRGLASEYMINLLRNAAAMLGKSSFMNVPRLPIKLGGTVVAYMSDSIGLGVAEAAAIVNQLTFDDEYINKQRQVRESKRITDFSGGLVEAGRSVVQAFEGMGDFVRKPMEGGRKEGVAGFVTGIGKGLAGTFFKPWSSFGQAIADVGSGIAAFSTPDTIAMKRRRARFRARLPRLLFTELGAIRPWDNLEADVQSQLGPSLATGVFEILPLSSGGNRRQVLLLFSRKLIVAEIQTDLDNGETSIEEEIAPDKHWPLGEGYGASSSSSSASAFLAGPHQTEEPPLPLDLFEALDESTQRIFSQLCKPLNALADGVQDLDGVFFWKEGGPEHGEAIRNAREFIFADMTGVTLTVDAVGNADKLLLQDASNAQHALPLSMAPVSLTVSKALEAGFRSALVHTDSIANWDALHDAIRTEKRCRRKLGVENRLVAQSSAMCRNSSVRRSNEGGVGERILEVYEVQRRMLTDFEWRAPFLPTDRELGYRWVDATGTRHPHLARGLNLEQVAKHTSPPCELDAMFRPVSAWTTVVDEPSTDSEGWMYSIAWNSSTWEPKPAVFDVLRKRKWRRVFS